MAAQSVPANYGETILLVDDDAIVRKVIGGLLVELGYLVIEAATGEEALRLARGHGGRIDLLLTDVAMPGMEGPELAEHFAREHGDVSVLFVSGSVVDGLSRLLPKPFSVAELSSHVRAALDEGRVA